MQHHALTTIPAVASDDDTHKKTITVGDYVTYCMSVSSFSDPSYVYGKVEDITRHDNSTCIYVGDPNFQRVPSYWKVCKDIYHPGDSQSPDIFHRYSMPLLNFTLVGGHATDGITSREMFQEVSSPTTAAATAAEVSALSDDDPPRTCNSSRPGGRSRV